MASLCRPILIRDQSSKKNTENKTLNTSKFQNTQQLGLAEFVRRGDKKDSQEKGAVSKSVRK